MFVFEKSVTLVRNLRSYSYFIAFVEKKILDRDL